MFRLNHGKWVILICLFLLLLLSCGKPETPDNHEPSKSRTPSPRVLERGRVQEPLQASAPKLDILQPPPLSKPAIEAESQSRRFIAVRHDVVIETSESELSKSWDAVNEFCQTIHCEVVSSDFRQKTSDSPSSAQMKLRVAPADVKQLFVQLGKLGTVLEHRTESEDLTDTVIDVEAKSKNLTELRDRLRKMLAARPGALKDVMEVERELFRVQSELDSLQRRRKVLAHETEKVSVVISFRSKKSVARTGTFAPIVSAWYESIHILAQSIALVITFIVAIAPWLVLFGPILWILIRVIKKIQAKRIKDHQKLIHPNES